MGMYTEVFIRANISRDAPTSLADWLDNLANGDDTIVGGNNGGWQPYDDHRFFTRGGWERIFQSGGAVYQISRRVQFARSTASFEDHELIIHASSKFVPYEDFIEWIAPWLNHCRGDFLGYSLYEDSRPSGYDQYWGGKQEEADLPDRERPELIFMPELPVKGK